MIFLGDDFLLNKLTKLLNVKSLVTLALTGVFCYLAVVNAISQEFMTVYTVVIAFYFGTQAKKAEEEQAGVKNVKQ